MKSLVARIEGDQPGTVELASQFILTMPEDLIIAVSGAQQMDDAAHVAYRELICGTVSDYGFEESEAYFLCTQAGKMRVGNMVDPKYSLGASMLKTYLG